jgi:RNA polymerase sigma-70 factor (ECF subfamily)
MPDDNFTIDEPCSLTFDELRSLNDELVMAHLRQGHDDALGVLFDRYHRLVLHVALKILHDVGEAEDVMQIVFMEIYKLAVQYDPARGSTKTWILRCAHHRSINRRKHLLRRKFYASGNVASLADELPDCHSSVVASQEAKQLVEQGFQALSGNQRRVIELAYFEGLTLKEIAEETSETLGNVRHHYYRGLDKLHDILDAANNKAQVRVARKEISDAKA